MLTCACMSILNSGSFFLYMMFALFLQCVVLPMLLCVVNWANLPSLFVFFNHFINLDDVSKILQGHNRMLLRVLFQILLQFFESNGRDKFAKLSAHAKGFLTRCLMKTAKVQGLIQTIKVIDSHVHWCWLVTNINIITFILTTVFVLWTSIPQGSSEALISVELPSSCYGNTGYTQKIMYFKEVNKSVVLIILFLSTSLDEKQSINITYVIGSCSS